jgi:CubicO group peptidase (beta-lactamase class C family)
MRRSLAALVASTTFVMALAGCTDDSDTPGSAEASGGGDDARGQGQVDCDPELDAAFRAWEEAGFSGSVALSTGGEIDCLAAYGTADEAAGTPNTVDTVFGIGSVSKAFTAAAIFRLADDGELSLDDRAGDLVPGLAGPAADATVEQLLLHISGLTGSHGTDHEPLERDAAVAAIGGLEQAFEPGSDFLYSNAGYTLLALIVEETSGMDHRDYMASRILPLPDGDVAGGFWDGEPAAPGPRAVGYLDDGPTDQMGDFAGPHWALSGNGDLAMTTEQLAAWTHALFTGQVVSQESADVIASPGFDHGDGAAETPGWVAYDASLLGEPFLGTAGGGGDVGHEAVVVWFPESERVIAMASNTPDVTAEQLLDAVGPALAAGDPVPTPEVVGDVDPADVADMVGTYDLGTGGSFDVSARDDRLAIAAHGADAVTALFPLPEDVTDEDVSRHEQAVMALLRGETPQGQEERAAVEDAVGPVDDIELAGSIVRQGELRTYVTVTSASEPTTLWYALDDQGGISAVEIGTEPPTLLLGTSDDSGYRPDDPTGAGPDVTVELGDGRMTITGPIGSTTARLAA